MMEKPEDRYADIARTLGVEGSGRPRRILTWRLLPIAAAIAAAAGVILFMTGSNNNGGYVYKTQKAARGDLVVTVSATGTLQPINEVEVGSELSGIIRTVEVDYNDRVEKGQVLARLDTDKLEAKVLQSRASLETARAKLLQAQATLAENESSMRRIRRLLELTKGESPSALDVEAAEAACSRARAEFASAKAQVIQAEASLKADETDLSKALIRSPVNGVVLERVVEPGQTVAASLQAPVLFKLAEDLAQMELHVDVDEADIGEVREGQEAVFTVDAYPDKKFSADVRQVRFGAQTSGSVVTYKAILNLDNKDLLLRPGMTATADIVVKRVRDAVLVPNAALRFTPPTLTGQEDDAGKNTSLISKLFQGPRRREEKPKKGSKGPERVVWVLKGEEITPVSITTGSTDGSMTEVLKGAVTPGTPVVVDASKKKG
jgi:HlyD family secretion protein